MAEFLWRCLLENRPVTVNETLRVVLPSGPLSAILVTVRAQNIGVPQLDATMPLAGLLASAAVYWRGQRLYRGVGDELWHIPAVVSRWPVSGTLRGTFDLADCWFTVPICFGRRAFDVWECLPWVEPGELELELSLVASTAFFNGVMVRVETIELPGARPSAYLKVDPVPVRFRSPGREVFRLPRGNALLGVMLKGSQIASPPGLCSWEVVRVLVDGREAFYGGVSWMSLRGTLERRVAMSHLFVSAHRHMYDGAAVGREGTGIQVDTHAFGNQFVYLDFDPVGDGAHRIETRAHDRVELVRDRGSAVGGNFYWPVELVQIPENSARALEPV